MGDEEVELIMVVVWEMLVDDEELSRVEDKSGEDVFVEDWAEVGCGSFLISRKKENL